MTTAPFLQRLCAAPISWGVCEAPGWGHEMSATRVLSEMRELGITSTELGPTGYLGERPAAVKQLLREHQLRLVGGFLPVSMHVDPNIDLTEPEQAIATLADAGSEIVVLAAQSADGSYDHKVNITDDEWTVLLHNLARLQDLAAQHGLRAALHPHVGTAIESRDSVLRLIASSQIPLCLDTGHLLIGGMQPSELLELAADRIEHVHLKDVRSSVAATVAGGDTTYIEAVRAGLYMPLGDGDLDIAAIVGALEANGYHGWYVLEQDSALVDEPAAAAGPVLEVARSIEFLRGLELSDGARPGAGSAATTGTP